MLKYCKLTKKPKKPNLTRPKCLVALNELALPLKLSLLPARPIKLIFWPQACLPSYQFQIKSCSVAKQYQWLSFWIQVSIVWMAFWRDWTWREMNEGVSSHQLLRAQVERWHEQFSIWFLWDHLRTGLMLTAYQEKRSSFQWPKPGLIFSLSSTPSAFLLIYFFVILACH